MEHSNKDYFDWQRKIGEFGGKANLFKFEKFIKPTDRVIDYGCGGAFLLQNINCKEKLGLEINAEARKQAAENGIKTVGTFDEIPDEWADTIISNNALEHTLRPFDEILNLKKKLKKHGKIIFVIPHDIRWDYNPNDINKHIFTWSPMCAGNMFNAAGFKVEKVITIKHFWPPFYFRIQKFVGWKLFHLICKIYSRLFGYYYQVRVIATKP